MLVLKDWVGILNQGHYLLRRHDNDLTYEQLLDAVSIIDSYPELWYTTKDTPCAYITISLIDTPVLCYIADKIRIDAGLKPFFYGEDLDLDCWNDFTIAVFDRPGLKVADHIEFYNDQDDGFHVYNIWLNEEDRTEIQKRLDKNCKAKWDKTLDEILNDYRKEIAE